MQSKLNLRAITYCTSLMIYNRLYRELLGLLNFEVSVAFPELTNEN